VAHQNAAGVDLVHRRGVDRALGVEVADEADVVNALRDIWEQRRDFAATLAVLLECPRAAKDRIVALGELADDLAEAFRQALAVHLVERRLRIECVDLARAADHEKEDDGLRFRGEVRRFRRERIHACGGSGQHGGKRDRAKAVSGTNEDVAASNGFADVLRGHTETRFG
jgi:hypothetical protein